MPQLFKNLTCFDEACPSSNEENKGNEILTSHSMVHLRIKKEKWYFHQFIDRLVWNTFKTYANDIWSLKKK